LKTVAERPRVQIPPRPFIYMVRIIGITYGYGNNI